MLDPARGILALLEYIHEKLPGMGSLCRTGQGLPPVIKIDQVQEEAVNQLIVPQCEYIQKDYDFTLYVDYSDQTCRVYVDEPLGFIKMCIEVMGNVWVMPVDVALEKLRERVYGVHIATG